MDFVKEKTMNFVIEDNLKAYMEQSGKRNIMVELVTAETSDIEISELHVYLAEDKRAAFFLDKKRYRCYETDAGKVLLPPFPLQCGAEIRFWLKKVLCFKLVGYEGLKV